MTLGAFVDPDEDEIGRLRGRLHAQTRDRDLLEADLTDLCAFLQGVDEQLHQLMHRLDRRARARRHR